jgi:hypothetical protein
MEIAALAAFLAPFLPHLLKPAQEAVGDLAERFGQKAVAHAEALWQRLQNDVTARPSAREAVEDVASAPEDEDARAAMVWQLKKLFNDNPGLAAQVTDLWRQTESDPGVRMQVIAQGERSVAVGGNVTGDVITGVNRAHETPE